MRLKLQDLYAELYSVQLFLFFLAIYSHIFRFYIIIFFFLPGSTFSSISDAILDLPGNNIKYHHFLVDI